MNETPADYLLGMFRKCRGFVARGLITGPEFINKAFDSFADLERVYPEVIPDLWKEIHEDIRDEFRTAVRNATLPGFHYHAFHFGGGRAMTDEEWQRDAELRTTRVRAWAVEFVRFWDRAATHS
jgi:hypothetical protein